MHPDLRFMRPVEHRWIACGLQQDLAALLREISVGFPPVAYGRGLRRSLSSLLSGAGLLQYVRLRHDPSLNSAVAAARAGSSRNGDGTSVIDIFQADKRCVGQGRFRSSNPPGQYRAFISDRRSHPSARPRRGGDFAIRARMASSTGPCSGSAATMNFESCRSGPMIRAVVGAG
jgi:hypothetical protein